MPFTPANKLRIRPEAGLGVQEQEGSPVPFRPGVLGAISRSRQARRLAPFLTIRQKDTRVAFWFQLPMILVIVGLVAYPFFEAIRLSLTDQVVGGAQAKFIGLGNYQSVFGDTGFRNAFRNTMVWSFATIALKLSLGMAMALVLHQTFRGSMVARGLLLTPWIIPTPISALVWVWIFSDIGGVLNGLLNTNVAWLGSPTIAFASVLSVQIWRGTPFFGITLLAGLKSIPKVRYEAASIDGANALQRFIHVTLPGLRFVILVACLLESVWALGDFSIVWIMTRGGPAGATQLLATLSYQTAFLSSDLARGIAISLFPLPILALIIVGFTHLMDKGKDEA